MAKNRFDELFSEADAAFDGAYSKELDALLGLSREELDKLTPGGTGNRIYWKLIRLVEQASKDNMSQAELAENIKLLGTTGVKIARKVPGLASLF